MFDLRKVVIIFVIATLFSILVFSTIDAFYPRPDYSDFCNDRFPKPVMREINCAGVNIPDSYYETCSLEGGDVRFDYNESGCEVGYSCDYCRRDYDASMGVYNLWHFMISAIAALIAISIGLYLPSEKENLNQWIGTGFMLGGLFVLFFSTATSYQDLDRILRPIVILIELLIVLYISYKKLRLKK